MSFHNKQKDRNNTNTVPSVKSLQFIRCLQIKFLNNKHHQSVITVTR